MIEQRHLLEEVSRLIDDGVLQSTLTETLSPISVDILKLAHTRVESGTLIGEDCHRGVLTGSVHAYNEAGKGRRIEDISGRERWDLMKTVSRKAMPARSSMMLARPRCMWGRSDYLSAHGPAGV